MQRVTGQSWIEGFLVDWVSVQPDRSPRLTAAWADEEQVAARLARIERNRAMDTAEEAELILRLAELRPDDADPRPGRPGARSASWRRSDPEFPGSVSSSPGRSGTR